MLTRFPCVLLASGGIDSLVAYYWLNKPQTVYFYLSSRYSKKEWLTCAKLFPKIISDSSLNLKYIEKDFPSQAYIPFRNLFLACMTAAQYSDMVYFGGLKDDQVSDKNEQIFQEFSALLSKLENREIKILSPFWHLTKSEVVKWYLDQGLPKETLLKTVSCYDASDTNYCGSCASCFRKWVALWVNGLPQPFYNETLLQTYKARCLDGKYDPMRSQETLRAIDEYTKSGCG